MKTSSSGIEEVQLDSWPLGVLFISSTKDCRT